MFKNDEFFCDSCKKRIPRERIVFNVRQVDFCQKCFGKMLNVDNAISNQNGTRTICEIARVTHLCDEEIPY